MEQCRQCSSLASSKGARVRNHVGYSTTNLSHLFFNSVRAQCNRAEQSRAEQNSKARARACRQKARQGQIHRPAFFALFESLEDSRHFRECAAYVYAEILVNKLWDIVMKSAWPTTSSTVRIRHKVRHPPPFFRISLLYISYSYPAYIVVFVFTAGCLRSKKFNARPRPAGGQRWQKKSKKANTKKHGGQKRVQCRVKQGEFWGPSFLLFLFGVFCTTHAHSSDFSLQQGAVSYWCIFRAQLFERGASAGRSVCR